MKTLLAIDFDPWAAKTYAANFPDVEVRCSKVEDELDALPVSDFIIGGPPCQSFSVAGKGLGHADSRNGWPAFVAAVRKVRPRMFLAENVAGMLSPKHIRYFAKVYAELEKIGYVVLWELLDSVNYGVPQFRQRVWVWGIRADLHAAGMRHEWPKPTHAWPPPVPGMFGGELLPAVTAGQALGLDGAIRKPRSHAVVRRDHPTNEPCPTVEARAALGGGSAMRIVGGGRNGPVGNEPKRQVDGTWTRHERDITAEPCTTIAGAMGGALNGGTHPRVVYDHGLAEPQSRCPTIKAGANTDASGHQGGAEGLVEIMDDPKHQPHQPHQPANSLTHGMNAASAYVRTWEDRHQPAEPAEPAGTVRARSPRDGGRCTENVVRENLRVRKLTPLECARLMSMPDDFCWPEKITKTAMYRIIGNGQCSLMVHRLAECIARVDPDCQTIISLFCGGGVGDVGFHGRCWQYQRMEQ